MKPAFIHSENFSRFEPPNGYPWSVERTEAAYRLCKKMNLLDHALISVRVPKPAKESELYSYRDKRYIRILKKANKGLF